MDMGLLQPVCRWPHPLVLPAQAACGWHPLQRHPSLSARSSSPRIAHLAQPAFSAPPKDREAVTEDTICSINLLRLQQVSLSTSCCGLVVHHERARLEWVFSMEL